MKDTPRVVFDTNILFSATGWQGNPYQCVQAARRGECRSITCESILSEFAEKLQLKRGFNADKVSEVINEIRAFSQVVPVPGKLRVIADDPDDDVVLECAVVGQARFLVSGDWHLVSLSEYEGIRIVKAVELLELLRKAPAS